MPSASYYCGFKASDIGAYLYKIHDDNIRPKQFLDTDNDNGLETILSEHKGHSLHEYIDSDDLLQPIIDFNLS